MPGVAREQPPHRRRPPGVRRRTRRPSCSSASPTKVPSDGHRSTRCWRPRHPPPSSTMDVLRRRGRLQDDRRPEQGARAAGAAHLVPDPGGDLPLAARRRDADPDVAGRRRRHDQRRSSWCPSVDDGVQHRPDAGRDARAGRRHRLRAVHPLALPAPARRGSATAGESMSRAAGDRRQRRRLRRNHRDHRPGRARRGQHPGPRP